MQVSKDCLTQDENLTACKHDLAGYCSNAMFSFSLVKIFTKIPLCSTLCVCQENVILLIYIDKTPFIHHESDKMQLP